VSRAWEGNGSQIIECTQDKKEHTAIIQIQIRKEQWEYKRHVCVGTKKGRSCVRQMQIHLKMSTYASICSLHVFDVNSHFACARSGTAWEISGDSYYKTLTQYMYIFILTHLHNEKLWIWLPRAFFPFLLSFSHPLSPNDFHCKTQSAGCKCNASIIPVAF
jgi:hypothetical protein